jgi:hypothetical protein
MNPHADCKVSRHTKKADIVRSADCDRREEENDQQHARRDTLGVVECRTQVSTGSSSKRVTGGGRTPVSTTSGGKRGTGGG